MRRLGRALELTLLALVGLVMVTPFLYMVSVSLMGTGDTVRWPPPLLPGAPTTLSYAALPVEFMRSVVNSLIVAVAIVAAQVVTSASAGYALARLRFPGSEQAFTWFLGLLTIPAIVLLVPRAAIVSGLGGVDTYAGLASTGVVSLWGVLLLRRHIQMLPREVEDAARLDGAGEWTVLSRVVLPRCTTVLVALAAVAFVDAWKNLIWPLVVTESIEMQVVEVGLARLYASQPANWPYLMAAGVVAALPPVLVLLFTQRSIITAAQVATTPRGIPASN
jgi:multiple sugar transport system permease protein